MNERFVRPYKHFDLVLALFIAVLLISNIASSAKIVDWGISFYGLRLSFDAGTLLFPLSYIFGDVLTEVYGYAKSRRVIWTGFFAAALMSFVLAIVGKLPGESQWLEYAGNDAYQAILGGVASGGIIAASLSAYFFGEFSNSFVLAKMKVWMNGKMLWVRTIGSTLIGEGVDTVLFTVLACTFGVFPWDIALSLIISNYIFKVTIEVLFTPFTYRIVAFLKHSEQVDVYDKNTNFNPFRFT